MSVQTIQKAMTVPRLQTMKGKEKITALTAYDFPTAQLLDSLGIEILLVGDSLGSVLYGHPNTLSVTIEDILRHTQAVSRAAQQALVVADMPFMSYQVSLADAVRNAGRFLKEAGAQAIKLEGGIEMAETVRAIVHAGIPVMAHIGLTPQSIHALGNYRMHGKSEQEKAYLIESAQAVTQAGAFSVVLECIETSLADELTSLISIPTIGIGSGPACDGQILVTHDLVGLTSGKVPRFVEPTVNLNQLFAQGIEAYIQRTKEK